VHTEPDGVTVPRFTPAPERISAGRLDFDNLGAQIGEYAGAKWRGDVMAQLNDLQPGQRSRTFFCHAISPANGRDIFQQSVDFIRFLNALLSNIRYFSFYGAGSSGVLFPPRGHVLDVTNFGRCGQSPGRTAFFSRPGLFVNRRA
jgi:hypothetical protein